MLKKKKKKGKLQFTLTKLSPICNSNTNVLILLIAPHYISEIFNLENPSIFAF
jgi:hypothetical protein